MNLNKVFDKLTHLMKDNEIDLLIVGPSSELEYLTGLNPLVDERFKALFIFADKRYFYIAPELYYEETRELLGKDVDIFKWGDGEGFLTAVTKAEAKYLLSGKNIGISNGVSAVDLIDIRKVVNARFINACSVMENLRIRKTAEERDNLRKAASIADTVIPDIVKFIQPGMTEKDIKNEIERLLLEHGGQGTAFETIVASGPNSSRPHYNGDKRVIEKNDVIIMDFGCKYNGYCSDTSRTVFVGQPTEEQKKVYSIVLKANEEGERCAKEGATAEEVDAAARNVIKDAGYGQYFINRTGHGVGTAVHEGPYIKEGNKQVLEDGMAFSVEPGIYIPGKFGMRVEDIVLINDGKGEIMNKSTKDMNMLTTNRI